ncbi:glycosyltransferase family 4 protein [Jatrophihabitans sp. GAS493]|uniref:glycosyltransferase family 4 protein n=1 Tax=Jatrophihabitans sp. GAS493 TaxID=1907575 RepID=UPI0012FDC0EF|nr:glycosyltransferase family 4 protein [Jatrophihabitans sp. GAS493]
MAAHREVGLVLTGDALMYALASPLLRLFRIRHDTMIMGLDVTYDNRLYRALVHPQLRRAEHVVAISAATAAQARRFGVRADHITVLRLGMVVPSVSAADRAVARETLHVRLGLSSSDQVVLTLGRLVRRKGAAWFVSAVLPSLPPSVHYVLAGDGPEAERIADSAAAAGVADRVHLLGRVDDDEREQLMCGADLFVQPNVAVPGDMEGFGLVTIEAAMRATPVVAADLEGISDAVVADETGVLLPSADADRWIGELTGLLADPTGLAERGARYAVGAAARYSEGQMGDALCRALGLLPAQRGDGGR